MQPSGPSNARTAVERGTLLLFLAALFAPIIDQCVRPSAAREPANENRSTRPMPQLPRSGRDLYTFSREFEGHHADTFGLRDVLLRWNSKVKLGVFGQSPAPMLVLDDSGWVDYSGEGTLSIWRGALPWSEAGLKEWVDYLALCRDFCARNGTQYFFLGVPNKETIYPDHVPARFTRFGPSRFDQIVAGLPPDLRPAFVDTRKDLLEARAQDAEPWDYLYSLYGTHWNGRGTWVTYRALMRAIGSVRDDVHALGDVEVQLSVDPWSTFDSWGPRMYLPDQFLHKTEHPDILGARSWTEVESTTVPHARWTARNPSSRGPRVLVFHDSFGAALQDLFASTFAEVTFVHSWFDPAIVLARHPDIVLEERVERIFFGPPMVSLVGREIMQQDAAPHEAGDLLVTIDAQSPDSALATTGPAHVERKPNGIAFRADTGRAGWFLPAFTVGPGTRAWLHVDLESQERGTLVAYRKSNETGAWLRVDAAYVPFEAGRTQRIVALPGPPGPRELRLQVSDGPTGVLVRHLEVRTTEDRR